MPGNLVSWLENVQNSPFADSRQGLFFRTPLQTLSPVLLSVTLSSVPFGVNGGDTQHYLGIYNNAGVLQEVVLINGGSAVSGTISGTLSFAAVIGTYAPGTYKLGSVTTGVQEAHNISSTNGLVLLAQGNLAFHAFVYVNKTVTFQGHGMLATNIILDATGKGFQVVAPGVKFSDFEISCAAQQTAGYGIKFDTNETFYHCLTNLRLYNLWDGVLCQTAYQLFVDGCTFINCGNNGLTLQNTVTPDSGGNNIVNCNFSWFAGASVGQAGIRILSTGGICISNCGFSGYKLGVYESGGLSSGLMISNNDFENLAGGCIRIDGAYGRICISNNALTTFVVHGVADYWAVFINGAGYGTLTGNNVFGTGANIVGFLFINAAHDFVVGDNNFYNMLYAVETDGSAVNVVISNNPCNGVSQEIAAASDVLVNLMTPMIYAHLQAWVNGSIVYCTDGKVTNAGDNTLTSGGTGCLAIRINGVWRAFATQN